MPESTTDTLQIIRSCCREADAVVEDNISHCQSQTMTVCERAEIYIHFPPIPQTCFFLFLAVLPKKWLKLWPRFCSTYGQPSNQRWANTGKPKQTMFWEEMGGGLPSIFFSYIFSNGPILTRLANISLFRERVESNSVTLGKPN